MAEPTIFIYNAKNERIALSKFQVLWDIDRAKKLGSFGENKVYDNENAQVGYFKNNVAFSTADEEVGMIEDGCFISDNSSNSLKAINLMVSGRQVGKCFPQDASVALSAVILLGDMLEERNS